MPKIRQQKAETFGHPRGSVTGARLARRGRATHLAAVGAVGVAALLAMPQQAEAGEVTRVASSFEEDDPFDLHFGVGYDFDFKKAAVLREWGDGNTNRLARDLIYRQQRHTVTASLEVGLWRDLSVYAELPIVVADNRNYAFDQEAADCVYPEDVGGATGNAEATCVNKTNSSSIRDGIIPRDGFDAKSSSPYSEYTGADTTLIFTAPTRRGIDQLHVGIKYGILNQAKRHWMPNWVIGAEGRFAIGTPMGFSRDITIDEPKSNTTVGRGTHELGLWTALSRRYRFLDPFFGMHWFQAVRASNTNFEKFDGMPDANPQSQVGMYMGTEIVPWEKKAKQQKVAIILSGSAKLMYGGRAYSEVWELLADSPALLGVNAPGNGVTSRDCADAALAHAAENPTDPSGYVEAANSANSGALCQPYKGITNVDDYGIFGLKAALNFHLGPYARLILGANMMTHTQHFVTAANRAVEGFDGIVEGDSPDVNPARRDVVDNVGRRYAVDDVLQVVGFANFWLTF